MKFTGFTVPEGAWMPPELIFLMPYLTPGQLKCTIAALYHFLMVGGGEPLSIADFERITGLSRRAIINCLQVLTGERGEFQVLEREQVGQSFCYYPKLSFFSSSSSSSSTGNLGTVDGTSAKSAPVGDIAGAKFAPVSRESGAKFAPVDPASAKSALAVRGEASAKFAPVESLRESERKLNINLIKDSLSDSLNLTDSGEIDLETRIGLLKELRTVGVYLQTAQQIVTQHSEAEIRKHLEYYAYALRTNFANGPGWFVTSIKENWPAPLGFEKNHGQHKSCPECGAPWVDGAYVHNRGCPEE